MRIDNQPSRISIQNYTNLIFCILVLNRMAEYLARPDEGEESMTTNDIGEYFELPDSFTQAYKLQHKGVTHRAMEMVENSLRAHRSCNEAIIFSYGLTGAGKTSTLNHLFGFEMIKIKERHGADTKYVTEYVATMKSNHWKVSNLQIGFIDVPGWGDGRSDKQDVLNMALIDQFISKHPCLGSIVYKCYPSIVMIALRADDNRIKGENSQTVRMFRALTKLNIIDTKRPNLLIVLTYVMSIGGRKNFNQRLKEMLEIVKDLAISYLDTEPVIVYIENALENHDMDERGDYTVLRDGTLQPRNVFQGMMQITTVLKDEVGQEAIRLYFTSRGSNQLTVKRELKPENLMNRLEGKWKRIIGKEFSALKENEVNEALHKYAMTNPEQYSENSLILLMGELETHSLTQLKPLQSMRLDQVKDTLHPYILSQLDMQALVNGCGVLPYQVTDVIQDIGFGRNAETGEVIKNQILKVEENWHINNGVCLPKSLRAIIPRNKRRVEWRRLSKPADSSFQQTTTTTTTMVKYQFQIIYTIYTIKVFKSDGQQLCSQMTPAFKEAVTTLPETSITEDIRVKKEYVDFLNGYGHRAIVGCECGGVIQGELEMKERESMKSQELTTTFINHSLDELETQDSDMIKASTEDIHGDVEMFKVIRRISLEWKGGKVPEQVTNLENLTPQVLRCWMNSLYQHPTSLETLSSVKDTNLPIFELVSLIDGSKCKELLKALTVLNLDTSCINLFTSGSDSSHSGSKTSSLNIDDISFTRERTATRYVSDTLGIARGGHPESSTCIRGSFEKFSKASIANIAENDDILCRDPLWVLFERAGKIEKHSSKQYDTYEYMKITHEYGEIYIGHKQSLLVKYPYVPPQLVLAKDVELEDIIYYIDVKCRKTMKTKVLEKGLVEMKGNYRFQRDRFSMIAIDQVITGGEEPTCFPGNATVVLRGGEKVRMDELKIGDYVLSIHPTTYKPVYSKVYLWAHRDPHITATFLHITHPHGHLHISANHLILTGDNNTPVPAHQLRVGDSIHLLYEHNNNNNNNNNKKKERGDSHTLISVHVLHIHTCTQLGYYTPFTNNGLIVVDNIATSVYCQFSTHSQSETSSTWLCHTLTRGLVQQFGMHRVGQCVLTPVRVGCKLGMGSVLSRQMDTHSHIHKYCQWLKKNFMESS